MTKSKKPAKPVKKPAAKAAASKAAPAKKSAKPAPKPAKAALKAVKAKAPAKPVVKAKPAKVEKLTKAQLAMLGKLSSREAVSRDSAMPLKTSQGKTAGFLAKRGLVALDLHTSTLRQIAWLTAAGSKLASDAAATLQSFVV